LVAGEGVVGGGVVLFAGLLDEPQPELVDVEVDVALRVAGDRGDVVDAFQLHVPPNPSFVISLSASSKTSVCRSTSACVVAGDISAMLWNGVRRTPRLSAA